MVWVVGGMTGTVGVLGAGTGSTRAGVAVFSYFSNENKLSPSQPVIRYKLDQKGRTTGMWYGLLVV